MKKSFAFLVFVLLASSCATSEIGRPINYEAAKQIEVGKTTKAEVLTLLGEPAKQRETADGVSEFGYVHIRGQAHALPFYARATAEGEKVVIKFSKEGIVQDISKTTLKK